MFDAATAGIRKWIVDLFANAIKHTSRPEDRQSRRPSADAMMLRLHMQKNYI